MSFATTNRNTNIDIDNDGTININTNKPISSYKSNSISNDIISDSTTMITNADNNNNNNDKKNVKAQNPRTRKKSQEKTNVTKITTTSKSKTKENVSLLESLPNDIQSYILSNLDLQSIYNTSQTSYNNYMSCYDSILSSSLWKRKFLQRWNYLPSSSSNTTVQGTNGRNWNLWYRNMYRNPNDIWCFHENCTWPEDGYIDGYTGYFEEEETSTSSTLSLQEHKKQRERNVRSKHAFQNFHIDLKMQQYKFNHPTCITDLLFFPLSDEYTTTNGDRDGGGTSESRRLLQVSEDMSVFNQSNIDTAAPSPTTSLKVTYHSWSIIKIVNPQYIRPIQFKIYIQEPTLFTVYPSEGYIPSGQEVSIVFGVTNSGSWLSFVHQQIVTRPICIQYWFTTVIPCSNCIHDTNKDSGGIERRDVYLHAHVHPYYALDEFHAHALHSPLMTTHRRGVFYIAPILQFKYPNLYAQIDSNEYALKTLFESRKKRCLDKYRSIMDEVDHWIECVSCITHSLRKELVQDTTTTARM